MADFVKSVEYNPIQVTVGTKVTANLTKSQNFANCIPFYTVKCAANSGDSNQNVRGVIAYESGPKVSLQKTGTTNRPLDAGIFTVEIDTAGDVSIVQGTFSMLASEASITKAISSVGDLNKAFVIISYRCGDNTTYQRGGIKVQFNSVIELQFDRFTADAAIEGTYYIVWTTGTDFSVQHKQLAMSTTEETDEVAMSAVTLANSFVIMTHDCLTAQSDDALQHGVVVDLKDTTTVRARRAFLDFADATEDGAVSNADTVEAQIVSAGASEFTVERKEADWANTTTDLTKDVTVTAIDQANAVIVSGSYQGHQSNTSTDGTKQDAYWSLFSFQSNTVVRATRGTGESAAADTGTHMFEVVEFGIGAAAGGRIMGSIAGLGGLAGQGGIAGQGGGLAG